MSGDIKAGQDCSIPLGCGKFLDLDEDDLPNYMEIECSVRVVFDAFVRYVKSNRVNLMYGGGTASQPKVFWELDGLYSMVSSESMKLRQEFKDKYG